MDTFVSKVNNFLEMFVSFNDRLREERERLKFSQADFAAIAGAHRKSQGNYEQGGRYPDVAYLMAIAAVGADVQYIITGERSDMALTPDERQLLALFRAAPLNGKMAAVGALQGFMSTGSQTISGGQVFNSTITGGQFSSGNIVNKRKKI